MPEPNAGPSSRNPSFPATNRRISQRQRAALAVVTILVGLLLVRVLLPVFTWSWLLWIGVGVLAGALVGQVRQLWLAWLATGVAYGLEIWLGLDTPRQLLHGAIALGLAGMLPGAGFVFGAALGGHWDRRRLAGAAALAGAVVVGYAGVLAVIGITLWVASDDSHDCRTPAVYGWTYEAINYVPADDANLEPRLGTNGNWQCDSQGAPAGSTVVSSGGVTLDGWYIPAANGNGPDGPTLIIVPGSKSSKSEMLPYADLLHDRFNLLMMDLRGEGRSGGTLTLGLEERSDVEAMTDWLASTKHPTWIGGMSVSLGAASLLGAAVGDPRIQALVLDSMHATYEETTGTILEREWGQPADPGVWVIKAVGFLQFGGDVSDVDPVDSIARLGDRPVLLTHSEDDPTDRIAYSADVNLQAGLAAGVPVQLVTCSGPGHGELVNQEPCRTDWSLAVNSFLESAISR
jgi:hypothetical protein